MAITVDTDLGRDLAAFSTCVLTGTSTRAPILSTGLLESSLITQYSSGANGKLAITTNIGSGSSINQNDIITITGASGDAEKYNGRHKVVSYTTTSITLNTLWDSESTITSGGTLTRTNDGMRIRADVYNGTTFISSIYAQPIKRNWQIDVSGVLRTQFQSIFSLTAGNRPTTGMAFEYTVKLFEQWQDVDFSMIELETAQSEQTGIAHRTTDLTGQITGTTLPNSSYRSKHKILHHFLTNKLDDIYVIFTPFVGVIAGTQTIVNTTITNKHGFAVYDIPSNATTVKVKVTWLNNSLYTPIKDELTIIVPQENTNTRLYYLNAKGGFQTIECISWDDTTKTEKFDKFTIKSWTERMLLSVLEHNSSAAYFKDLANSIEIFDASGNQVELLTPSSKFYGNNVQLSLTIKYDQNIIN